MAGKSTAILLGAALALAAAACPSAPARADEAADTLPAPPPPRDTPTSRTVLDQVGRAYAFMRDPEVLDTVREIGDIVARAYHAPAGRYHFYVLNNPELNAFTTPSGDIFIFSGQLVRLRSEDELAGVLAHEIAHKEADHFGEISRRSAMVAIPTIAAMILSKGEEAVMASAIAVASAFQLQFSREMEEEADLMAVNALRKTSYDPLGMAGALEAIEKEDRLMPMEIPTHLSTHPPITTRRASLESIFGRPLESVRWAPRPTERWRRVRSIVAGLSAEPGELVRKWQALDRSGMGPRELHETGLTLMKAGRLREARRDLEQALSAAPGDALLHADLGAVCALEQDQAAARPHLEQARKELPDYAYPAFYLAEMERAAGRSREASILYLRAIDARPEIPEAYYQYGMMIASQARGGEAAYYLGVAALLNGEFREAQPLLREAQRKLEGNQFWRDRIGAKLEVFQ